MDVTTHVPAGISDTEAARLLAEHGPNELPEPRPPSVPIRVARQLADPLSILLLIAGFATLLVLREVPEGAAILAILVVNVVIGVSQEVKAATGTACCSPAAWWCAAPAWPWSSAPAPAPRWAASPPH